MSVFELNSRNLREVWMFCFHLKETAAEDHRMLSSTFGEVVSVKKCVVTGFNTSRAVILMSRIDMAVEAKKFSKIPNWRHYLLKTRAKRTNVEELADSLGVIQQTISKHLKAMQMIQKQGNCVPYDFKHFDYQSFPVLILFFSDRFLFVRKVTFGHERKALCRH